MTLSRRDKHQSKRTPFTWRHNGKNIRADVAPNYVKGFFPAQLNETRGVCDVKPFSSCGDIARNRGVPAFSACKGADMSTILSLLTLFYRESFRTKLAEMKALPPIPR